MHASSAPQSARQFTHSRLFEGLARSGYVARGLIYVLIGVLAFRLAEGVGGRAPSQQGALRTISDQSFGHALLVLMAIGLAGYALWRLAQAFIGATPEAGQQSTADRVAAAASAVAYAGFCALAIGILRGSQSSSATRPQHAAADVFGWPAGRELVGIAGLVFIGVAAYQAYYGLSHSFLDDSKTGEMSQGVRRGFTYLGVVGLVARAIAFLLIGQFLFRAALDYKARDAVGIDGALARLTNHAYGTTALIVVACGLVAFGAYSLADARYRKI